MNHNGHLLYDTMSDCFDVEKRSWVMSRIKGKNTKPEVIVRSLLHSFGYRFRLHVKTLSGTPDIVLPKHRTIIFVHGCFWHQHRGCPRSVLPKTNIEYWHPKLNRNVHSFLINKAMLESIGWKVFVVWECETKAVDKLSLVLSGIMAKGVEQ